MKKCDQVKCSEPAAWTYVWPGKTARSFACPEDFLRATGIAQAMGFPLGDARPMTMDEMMAEERQVDAPAGRMEEP